MVSSTHRPHFTPGKDPVPILQEAGWAPGPVWTGGKSRPHRDSIPNRPAHSQSQYQPGPYIFESGLIPALFLILVWGYQPERVQPGTYLFYTLLASLPLLVGILFVYKPLGSL